MAKKKGSPAKLKRKTATKSKTGKVDKYNWLPVMDKHLPSKVGMIRKVHPLWTEDFGDDNLTFFRVNYHNPYNSNYIEQSHFACINEGTEEFEEIKDKPTLKMSERSLTYKEWKERVEKEGT